MNGFATATPPIASKLRSYTGFVAQHSNPPLDTFEQLNHAATVLPRDGCDLLDVLGWRLRGD